MHILRCHRKLVHIGLPKDEKIYKEVLLYVFKIAFTAFLFDNLRGGATENMLAGKPLRTPLPVRMSAGWRRSRLSQSAHWAQFFSPG